MIISNTLILSNNPRIEMVLIFQEIKTVINRREIETEENQILLSLRNLSLNAANASICISLFV